MAVSTALAGVRQRNLFGIYMENFSTYRDAISEAEKAEGTAARKMQAYNESVAYSINQLSAAWEGFTQKLEASGAVKLFFNGLTAIIENLDHILQRLVPLIAVFNADKIISLGKFLSPLATFIPKAVVKGFKDRHGNGFYENMTQKMTAENTSAIKELTNATKDNTAALRGEKSKSDKTGVGKADEGAAKKGPETGVVTTKQKPYQKYSSDVRSRIDSLNYHISEAEKQGNVSAVEKLKKIKSEELRKIEGNKSEIISAYRKDTRDAKELAQKQIDEIDKRTQASKANALMRKEIAENAHKNGQVQSKLKEKDRRAAASQIRAAEVEASGEQQKKQILKERNDRLKEIKKRTKKDLREENKRLKQQEKEYNRANSTGRVKTKTDVKEPTPEERANLEAQKKLERSARLKTGAAAGLAAGATRLANRGSSIFDNEADLFGWFKGAGNVEVSDGEAAAMGGIQAVLTAGLTAWLGPFGTVLATIGGDLLSSLWKKLAHADEIDRKQRVQQAKDNLEAIKGVSTSVTGLIDIRKKGDTSLWDADDWKHVNEYVESINKAANASEKFSSAIGGAITNIESMSEAELANIEAARIKYEAEQTYAAGEQDRYTLMQQILENQKKLNDKDSSVVLEAQAAIASATAQIEEYSDVLKKSYMESAFYSSGVSSMNSIDMSSATLDRIVVQIAREWEEKGGTNIFGANDELLGDARSDIISFLRTQSAYSGLFNNRSKDVFEIKSALSVFGEDKKLIENLKDLSKRRDQTDLVKELQKLKLLSENYSVKQLNDLIDKINTADTTSISTIAHGLNMTVAEFEKVNESGAFDWLTSGDVLDGSDKFLEKMSSLSEIFSDLSKNASLSAENIQNVIKNYKFLLRDANGKMSAENIAKNFGDMFINGINSQVAQAYVGMRSREAMTDRDIWSIFVSDKEAIKLFKEEQQGRLKAAKTYEEVIDIMEETEGAKDAFWGLAQGLIGEMDLFKEMRGILIEYQTSSYDAEISNLQSIKDALGDINKQREKELELIKAKEALENASKEKIRVYREGVGFVYTTNQEAVRSAQEKIDELEMTQTQDDIQYQIDILNQQKSILENVAKNEELEALEKAVSKFFGNSSMNNLISAIFSINDKDYQDALKKEFVKNGISTPKGVQSEIDETKKQKATSAYNEALKTFKDNYENYKINEGDVRYKDYVVKKNAAIEDLAGLRRNAIESGVSSDSLENLPTQDKVPLGIQKINVATENKLYSYEASGVLANEESINKEFGKSVYKKDDVNYYVLKESNGNYFVDRKIDSEDGITYQDVEDKLQPGDVLIVDRGTAGWWDFGVYKGADEKIYTLGLEGGAGHIDIRDKVVSENNFKLNKNALGALSYSGGPSLINENGLESIITPQGTITSLPAKSGIVPADLTRNLWALGEVAPNLIARLGGNSLQTNNSNSSTDNSINIQNLDATFNTQSDFDGHRFLTDLRNQVILTANNH